MSFWQQHLIATANRPLEVPENVPRLYDLVRVKDERVKPAFYFALRNTLVAENLEQATRIGYGRTRYRIVTLKGELIEPSGTMSGGGKSCMRGRMGRNVATDTSGGETSAKDIARMEDKMQQLSEECARLRESKLKLEDALVEITKSTREGNTNLQKWKMEIKVSIRTESEAVEIRFLILLLTFDRPWVNSRRILKIRSPSSRRRSRTRRPTRSECSKWNPSCRRSGTPSRRRRRARPRSRTVSRRCTKRSWN